MSNKIAIIDIDSVIFTAFHPNKVLDNNGNPTRTEDGKRFIYKEKTPKEIIESCDFLMNSMLEESEATGYIAFVKGWNTTQLKEAVNPEYKADRNKESPKLWNFTKEYLKLAWNVYSVNNIETDDAVNISRLKIDNSFICAIDSDLLGLEGKHYNWRKKEWITNTKEQEDSTFWTNMICGTHNNTKGLKGKGPAYVDKLFDTEHIEVGVKSLHDVVLSEFILQLGEEEGIKQFYANYVCTKLLTNYDGFTIPEINEYNKQVQEW